MAYDDYIWIYDVNWMATKDKERPVYHAFAAQRAAPDPKETVTSACGKMTTTTYETKTPGARDCEECLAVTGRHPMNP